MVNSRFFILLFMLIAVPRLYSQNVGIGLINPVHSPLEVAGAVGRTVALFGGDKYGVAVGKNPPFVGFNYLYNSSHQVIRSGYASLIWMDTANGNIHFGNFNNNTSGDFGTISNYQTRMLVQQNGYVGIGTVTPSFPLAVYGNGNDYGIIQKSPDGSAGVGFYASVFESGVVTTGNIPLNFTTGNGVMKMQLRTNGDLYVNENITINQNLTATPTGTINLLPVAMGKVAAVGSMLSATPGVFVSKITNGNYAITLSSEPNLYANRDHYQLQLSVEGNTNAFTINYIIRNDNTIFIKTWRPYIGYITPACSCGGSNPSVVTGQASLQEDCGFSFLIRKF